MTVNENWRLQDTETGYLYTVTKENQQSGSSILGFLSEPVRIHSNVKGGLGILGAKASINLQLDINTSDTTTRH